MGEPQQLELAAAGALPAADALSELGSSEAGLSSLEARRRLASVGPNVLLSHGVSALSVLVRQLRSYLLLLLLVAAVVSAVLFQAARWALARTCPRPPRATRRPQSLTLERLATRQHTAERVARPTSPQDEHMPTAPFGVGQDRSMISTL